MTVADYIAEGWAVVPIPKGEKGPRVSNWQHTTFTEEDFKPDDNIGIRLGTPSQGLIDVDLDAPQAVIAARKFLPTTERIHGRPGKPKSHWWYFADLKSEQFKDIDGSVLAEIRSTGGQTVVPPSVHPSGEVLSWEIDRMPARPEALFLRRMVVRASITALLARHWPKNGPLTNQHETAGLVAGFLCSLKLQPVEVEYVVGEAARIGRDDNVKDRTQFAADTVRKFHNGDKVRGGPELSKELGEDIIKRIRSWFGDTTSSVIDEMNLKHAVLFAQHGKIVILTEYVEGEHLQLRFSDPSQMALLYPQLVKVSEDANGRAKMRPLGTMWLTHPKRRFYEGIELAPNGNANKNYYNLWRGFSCEPKQGDWSLFKEHLLLMADGSQEWAEYIFAWMAQTVQHPEQPIGVALAFKGRQGTGKSTFVKWFGALFGAHFLHLDSEHRLLGNFNAHLHNTILIFADEAVWAGGKQGLGALKRLITEDTLAIERKGLDIINVKNMLHMMIASNEDWFVPVGFDNRRFAPFLISHKRQNDTAFFKAVHHQLFLEGGLQGLLYDLLAYQVKLNVHSIPETVELEVQKKHSMSAKHAWWLEVLQDGALWTTPDTSGRGALNDYVFQQDDVYGHYVNTLKVSEKSMNLGMKGALGRFLRTVMPEGYPRVIQSPDGKRVWFFPDLDTCRKFFDENYGKTEWLADNQAFDGADVPF